MDTKENATGKPLADYRWLEIHHRAKLVERTAFANKLSELKPKSIVDLGCASGLWLNLLNDIIPNDCTFIGIDEDQESLALAKEKSNSWSRKSSFLCLDLENEADKIPPSDLTLAFNIFPYIRNLDKFIEQISSRIPRGILAVRQYDGASIRFGPMPTKKRQTIESDLRLSTENSQKFYHYDLDRTFECLRKSNYNIQEFGFELFERTSPFPEEFIPYYNETLSWTAEHLSEHSSKYLKNWINEDPLLKERYFYEVDLVSILS